MPRYDVPINDMRFLLHDVLLLQSYADLPGFGEATPDVIDSILEQSARFAVNILLPLNKTGDLQGCVRNDDGSVTTPEGFREAWDQFVGNGWPLLDKTPEMGGQDLPGILQTVISEMISSANMAFGMYPGLTSSAYEALMAGGNDEQKRIYGPKMASGQWAGTMNLTEPQCGTDLGLIKTKAVPQGDGSYKITGQKIWISGGEQDLTENIIHLVLARTEGGAEGIKGISLFVVPKFIVDADGNPRTRNALSCGGLEEKMGIHGNSTCVMNYDGATGWLVGQENKGMRTMFIMMNKARLDVGLQGLSQAVLAYQNAVSFARERLQSRALTGPKMPEKPADSIIVHPDVRRMLMDQKAVIEAGRAFVYWTALQNDLSRKAPDEQTRRKASDYMALMTPVIKGFLTDRSFRMANDALQVHGGSGYTREWGMEQIVRDCRITMIYEGTNGIQALDLVGRKLAADGGRAVSAFFADLGNFIASHRDNPQLRPFVNGLESAMNDLQEATKWLMENGTTDFNNAGAASTDYLNLFGLTALAYMWCLIAKAAISKQGDEPFCTDKLTTGRYYMARILPETACHLAKLKTGAGPVMELAADRF